MPMRECLFCNIIAGDVPAEKVYEDNETYAFLDINPNNPGHTLIVPKNHSTNILDIQGKDWVSVMKTVHFLAPKIMEATNAGGINIAMNNKEFAGQIIDHTHVHIIPRHKDDGFTHWRGTPYKDGEAEAVAGKIKTVLL